MAYFPSQSAKRKAQSTLYRKAIIFNKLYPAVVLLVLGLVVMLNYFLIIPWSLSLLGFQSKESESWNIGTCAIDENRWTLEVEHIRPLLYSYDSDTQCGGSQNANAVSVSFCNNFKLDECHCRKTKKGTGTLLSIQWLELQLDCSCSPLVKPVVNFYAAAHGELYESFLPLYAQRALDVHNDIAASVEMVVTDKEQFVIAYQQSLAFLLSHYGPHTVCVREFKPKTRNRTRSANSWRFMEPPVRSATFTYLGDVDILLDESVLDSRRFEQMKHFGLPYSNIIRPNRTSLTGVMLLKTDEFYTPALLKLQRQKTKLDSQDEAFLYHLVSKAGLGLPALPSVEDKWTTFRPVHGLHLSSNRGPGKKVCHHVRFNDKWCTALRSASMKDLLCQDNGSEFRSLSRFLLEIDEEQSENMSVREGICQAHVDIV